MRRFLKKNQRVEEIQRIKSLLEIKNLAMEIAIKEKREFSDLPDIVNENALIAELFKKNDIERYKPEKLTRLQRMKYGLIGSMSVVVVLMVINLIYSPKELNSVVISLRDLGIGVIAGLLMAFYPGNSKKTVIVAGIIAPFVISMLFILFHIV